MEHVLTNQNASLEKVRILLKQGVTRKHQEEVQQQQRQRRRRIVNQKQTRKQEERVVSR